MAEEAATVPEQDVEGFAFLQDAHVYHLPLSYLSPQPAALSTQPSALSTNNTTPSHQPAALGTQHSPAATQHTATSSPPSAIRPEHSEHPLSQLQPAVSAQQSLTTQLTAHRAGADATDPTSHSPTSGMASGSKDPTSEDGSRSHGAPVPENASNADVLKGHSPASRPSLEPLSLTDRHTSSPKGLKETRSILKLNKEAINGVFDGYVGAESPIQANTGTPDTKSPTARVRLQGLDLDSEGEKLLLPGRTEKVQGRGLTVNSKSNSANDVFMKKEPIPSPLSRSFQVCNTPSPLSRARSAASEDNSQFGRTRSSAIAGRIRGVHRTRSASRKSEASGWAESRPPSQGAPASRVSSNAQGSNSSLQSIQRIPSAASEGSTQLRHPWQNDSKFRFSLFKSSWKQLRSTPSPGEQSGRWSSTTRMNNDRKHSLGRSDSVASLPSYAESSASVRAIKSLQAYPRILASSLLLLGVLLVSSVLLVNTLGQQAATARRDEVHSVASEFGQLIQSQLEMALLPLYVIESLILVEPSVISSIRYASEARARSDDPDAVFLPVEFPQNISRIFEAISKESLGATGDYIPVEVTQLEPLGILAAAHAVRTDHVAPIGLQIINFESDRAKESADKNTALATPKILLFSADGNRTWNGTIFRNPVYVDDSLGVGLDTTAVEGIDRTVLQGKRLWGFVSVILEMRTALNRNNLLSRISENYEYELRRFFSFAKILNDGSAVDSNALFEVVDQSEGIEYNRENFISTEFTFLNDTWVLDIHPKEGFEQSWIPGLIVIGVVISLILAGIYLSMMISISNQDKLAHSIVRRMIIQQLVAMHPEENVDTLSKIQKKLPASLDTKFCVMSVLSEDQESGSVLHVCKVNKGTVVKSSTYALKVISSKALEFTEKESRALDREAYLLSQIRSPHVVTLDAYGASPDDNSFWMLMQYLGGQTLDKYVAGTGLMSERQILTVAEHVLKGLRAIHEVGAIHRCINPSKIMRCAASSAAPSNLSSEKFLGSQKSTSTLQGGTLTSLRLNSLGSDPTVSAQSVVSQDEIRYVIIDLGSATLSGIEDDSSSTGRTFANTGLNTLSEAGTAGSKYMAPELALFRTKLTSIGLIQSGMEANTPGTGANLPYLLNRREQNQAQALKEIMSECCVDHRMDVWGVGITLFQLAAGYFPFPGDLLDVQQQITDVAERPPRLEKDGFGLDTSDLILKAMEKDVKERYQTADMMLLAVHKIRVARKETAYSVHLSYRAESQTDAGIAQRIHQQLHGTTTPDGRQTVTVSIHAKEASEMEHMVGLCNSIVHMPIISERFMAPLTSHHLDVVDGVLTEQLVALSLLEHRQKASSEDIKLQKIIPLFVGRCDHDGSMSSFFADGSFGNYPDKLSGPTTDYVVNFLQRHFKIDLLSESKHWSIKSTMDRLLKLQGLRMWDAEIEGQRSFAPPHAPRVGLGAEKALMNVVQAFMPKIRAAIHEVVSSRSAKSNYDSSLHGRDTSTPIFAGARSPFAPIGRNAKNSSPEVVADIVFLPSSPETTLGNRPIEGYKGDTKQILDFSDNSQDCFSGESKVISHSHGKNSSSNETPEKPILNTVARRTRSFSKGQETPKGPLQTNEFARSFSDHFKKKHASGERTPSLLRKNSNGDLTTPNVLRRGSESTGKLRSRSSGNVHHGSRKKGWEYGKLLLTSRLHVVLAFFIFCSLVALGIGLAELWRRTWKVERRSEVKDRALDLSSKLSSSVVRAMIPDYTFKCIVHHVPELLQAYHFADSAPAHASKGQVESRGFSPNSDSQQTIRQATNQNWRWRDMSSFPSNITQRFAEISQQILAERPSPPGFMTVQLAPAGVVSIAYSLEHGIETAAIGLDLLSDPAFVAQMHSGPYLQGPLTLLEAPDKQALITTVQIYIDEEHGIGMHTAHSSDRLYGFTESLLDLSEMLSATGFSSLEKDGYSFWLQRSFRELHDDGQTHSGSLVAAASAEGIEVPKRSDAVESINFTMLNTNWTLTLRPDDGMEPPHLWVAYMIVVTVGIVIAGGGFTAFSVHQKNTSLRQHFRTELIVADLKQVRPDADMQELREMQAWVPSELISDYCVSHVVGEGSSGKVFQVLKVHRGKVQRPESRYALKVVRNEGKRISPGDLARLSSEALALQHSYECPYIVTLHETCLSSGKRTCWFLMEHLEGQSLQERLEDKLHGPFSETDTYVIMEHVLLGLQHLHEAGITHRDIKPSNIIQCRSSSAVVPDRYVLIDLGSSIFVGERNPSRTGFEGTVPYLSPEQADCMLAGDKAGFQDCFDCSIDLWAVGVLTYHLLTGKLPFKGRTNTEILVRIADRSTDPPLIFEDLSESRRAMFGCSSNYDLADTVAEAMQKDTCHRFSTAAIMLDALSCPLDVVYYSVFLSYRVSSDSLLANMLFQALNNCLTPKNKRRVTVFLDSVRLIEGEDWEAGFSAALCNSVIHMPIISEGFTAPMAGEGATDLEVEPGRARLMGDDNDMPDNCLKEQQIAMALHNYGERAKELIVLQKVVPVFVGKVDDNHCMTSYFEDGSRGGGGQFPDRVSSPTTSDVLEFLAANCGLHLEEEAEAWTVKETMDWLESMDGIYLWEKQQAEPQMAVVDYAARRPSTITGLTPGRVESFQRAVAVCKEQILRVLDEHL